MPTLPEKRPFRSVRVKSKRSAEEKPDGCKLKNDFIIDG